MLKSLYPSEIKNATFGMFCWDAMQGANRSDTQRYHEDLQRRSAPSGAFQKSCSWFPMGMYSYFTMVGLDPPYKTIMTTNDHYAVIGHPISHSKSPYIHTHFAQQCQQAMSYQALLAPLDGFSQTVKKFIHEGGRGANVTLPFKVEAFELCDQLTERAKAAKAVNTLSFIDGKIVGDNTDGIGLVTDIVCNANVSLQHKRILLLGAGGAARGVLLPLLACKPSTVVIANRTVEKAQQLVTQFQSYGEIKCATFADIHHSFDVIINATSSSIDGKRPPIVDHVFTSTSFAYELMYANEPTLFMQHAANCGAKTRDGWGMLVEQAAEAFYLWRGVRPDTKELLIRR